MFDQRLLHEAPVLAKLAGLLAEPGVTDLVCNGFDSVQVFRGSAWQAAASPFTSEQHLADTIRSLVQSVGGRIDFSIPFSSVAIGDKLRVHGVLAGALSRKSLLSIRVLVARSFGLNDLVSLGVCRREVAGRIVELVRAKKSIAISGASGVGKTTLLRILLELEADRRIIAIEDVPELQLAHPSFVSLLTRSTNVEGRGAIDMNQLLAEALRMRADRLVVGEIRGGELVTLLQAANSGHAIATTIHANSAAEVPSRMLSIALASGISAEALNQLIKSSIDAFVHIEARGGQRTLTLHEVRN